MFKIKKIFLFIVAVLICGVGVLNGAVGVVKAETNVPSITIVSPEEGEILNWADTYKIVWVTQSEIKTVSIALFKNNNFYDWIAINLFNEGTDEWSPSKVIPKTNFEKNDIFSIEITGYRSDGGVVKNYIKHSFSIAPEITTAPSIISVYPTSGTSGDVITIYGKNLVDTIPSGTKIEFLKNGDQRASIGSQHISVAPDGLSLRFQLGGLLVENIEKGIYQMRFVNNNGKSNTINFTIIDIISPSVSFIKVLSPNGGEVWHPGETHRINWEYPGGRFVKIYIYSGSGSANYITPNGSAVDNRGPYDWTIPAINQLPRGGGTNYKIRIDDADSLDNNVSFRDESDNYFSIVSPMDNALTCIKDGESFNDVVLSGNRRCCEGTRAYMKRSGENEEVICKKIENYFPPIKLDFQKPQIDTQINQINANANQLHNNQFEEILLELKQLRDKIKEQANEMKYLRSLTKGVKELAQSTKDIINNFITYGVDNNTQKLGAGERAAVISSYKSAFDKLPETEAELTDAIKIANGRFPNVTSDKAEKKAKEQFKKIYKKIADMNDANDSAAIKVMAYGLRQKAENRNLNSEKVGIKIFKDIYKFNPSTTEDWNTMQAITYSGAKKELDTDGDLLPDDREKELGTNPLKADSDGDGHKDGQEVEDGYNPLKK